MNKILTKFRESKQQGRKQLAVLIDPDHASVKDVVETVRTSHKAKADIIFVGGSLIMHSLLDEYVLAIKAETDIPVVLFPGNLLQISSHADAILFLSLISGRNPELLIGKHVLAAPLIRRAGLEAIPTGYMLIEGGNQTSVSYMSNTNPIPASKWNIAMSTALAGQMLGMQITYLDAGSGATNPVSEELIRKVSEFVDNPVIVGGGIKTPEQAVSRCVAGADVIVIGNAIESDNNLVHEMAAAIHGLNPAKSAG